MAFSGKPNAHNRSLLSCFIRESLNWLSMKGNDMIGTIVQFIKQDGSSQQTMSIDQPPRVVIDAIRHGTPKFVRDQLTSGTVETIDILRTELNDEKHPQGKGERVETILVNSPGMVEMIESTRFKPQIHLCLISEKHQPPDFLGM